MKGSSASSIIVFCKPGLPASFFINVFENNLLNIESVLQKVDIFVCQSIYLFMDKSVKQNLLCYRAFIF